MDHDSGGHFRDSQLFIGTMLGAIAAWRRGSWFDTALSPLLTFFRRFPISGWR